MAKILQTRLPLSVDQNVTAETYNRAVRVLELNLNAVDVDNTPQFTQIIIDQSKFRSGDVIWNSTSQKLQVFDGDTFRNLSYDSPTVLATASVGTVNVITNGGITVDVSA